jgi:hypothetical protein
MKIHPLGAELFEANGQTDGFTKLIVSFRNFSKAPKQLKLHGIDDVTL